MSNSDWASVGQVFLLSLVGALGELAYLGGSSSMQRIKSKVWSELSLFAIGKIDGERTELHRCTVSSASTKIGE